ncbi:MAG: ATP-grasp domain-containing protein [Saprospiraceae bacterium]
MQKYKVLVLTDHTNHSSENSLYPLVRAMRLHPNTLEIDVASRGNEENHVFFNSLKPENIWAATAENDFAFSADGFFLKRNLKQTKLRDYDLIWLRMPPPLSEVFLGFLINEFPKQFIINNPRGIYETGSKSFLTNFKDLCPPMKICKSINDIIDFKNQFPIVLKPFREYGGRGIVRIDNNQVWEGKNKMSFEAFISNIKNQKIEYLGVQFLKNVGLGDKRIVVVNGKVMGASLRLPAENSWLCNIAMGGTSNFSEVDEDELQIVERVNPILSKMGIVMYGLDTLVNDNGKRVLSEINTTSIGGLPQIAKMAQQPLVEEAIDLIWQYFLTNKAN